METACILGWLGRNVHGYRHFRDAYLHRLAWEDANQASILPGYMVMHACDNRRCINPKHLSVGTASENMLDMAQKGRAPNRKLTALQVATIREWSALEVTTRAMAHWYSISQSKVSQVVRGRAWRHL